MPKAETIEIQPETELADMPNFSPIFVGIGATLSILSILAILWKIASFLQSIVFQITDIHKDMCRLSKEQIKLNTKYENIYFFLIRQHGIEVVQKHLRDSEHHKEENPNGN